MKENKQQLWTATFTIIVIVCLLGSMNGNGLHNGVSVLIDRAGGAAYLSGLITGLFSLAALFGRLISGSLSDAKGRKPVILIGCVLMVVGALLALVTSDAYSLLPARFVMGIGFGMVVTATAAAVVDIVPASRMGEGLGYQSLAYAISMAAGPWLAVEAVSLGRVAMFGIFGGMVLLALLLTWVCPFKRSDGTPVEVSQQPQQHATLADRVIERAAIKSAVVSAMVHMGLVIYMAFMSLYAEQSGIGGAGPYFLVAAVVMTLVRMVCSKAFDRLAANTLIIPSVAVGILGFVLPLLFNNFAALIAAGVCFGLFGGIVIPVLSAEAQRRSPQSRHGAASATFYVGCDVGMSLGSVVWGFVIGLGGFSLAFGCAAAFLLASIVVSLVLLRRA